MIAWASVLCGDPWVMLRCIAPGFASLILKLLIISCLAMWFISEFPRIHGADDKRPGKLRYRSCLQFQSHRAYPTPQGHRWAAPGHQCPSVCLALVVTMNCYSWVAQGEVGNKSREIIGTWGERRSSRGDLREASLSAAKLKQLKQVSNCAQPPSLPGSISTI